MAGEREEILPFNPRYTKYVFLLGDIQTIIDASLTKQCIDRYINHSCMPKCKFMDVKYNGVYGTPSNKRVVFVKAFYSIHLRGPITVNCNWELHKNDEIKLCDCQNTQCSGLFGI